MQDILNTETAVLTEGEKVSCEEKVTIYECEIALKSMEKNKSPVSDGINVDFCKLIWNDVKHYLNHAITLSFEHGHLTYLQKQGVIILIPK